VLTLFTVPKAFDGHIGVIQRNAIRSWMQLRPECEILLAGDDEGTAEVARELGLRHLPDIARSEYGTPLVSSAFEQAQRAAMHDLLCYVNADIIFLSDLLPSVQRIGFRRFLTIGQRWDVDLVVELDFTHPDWEARLRRRLAEDAVLHPRTGIDYFLFPRGLWGEIPPFAIGRTIWDNWFIYRARAVGAAVIDATGAITAVHQNHGYAHIPSGKDGAWKGAEAVRNAELGGGRDRIFTLLDANWLLREHGLSRALSAAHLRRAPGAWCVLHPSLNALLWGPRRLVSLLRRALAALRRPWRTAPG
jgi:hypothetical protein